jgi:hypothetical protein
MVASTSAASADRIRIAIDMTPSRLGQALVTRFQYKRTTTYTLIELAKLTIEETENAQPPPERIPVGV